MRTTSAIATMDGETSLTLVEGTHRNASLHGSLGQVNVLSIPHWAWASRSDGSTAILVRVREGGQEGKAIIDGRVRCDLLNERLGLKASHQAITRHVLIPPLDVRAPILQVSQKFHTTVSWWSRRSWWVWRVWR